MTPPASQKILEVKSLGNKVFELRCTLPDVLGLFSAIAGLLTCYGMNIEKCHAKTRGGKIIDYFKVKATKTPDWKKFQADLETYSQKLYAGQMDDIRSELVMRMVDFIRSHQDLYSKAKYIHTHIICFPHKKQRRPKPKGIRLKGKSRRAVNRSMSGPIKNEMGARHTA